MPPTLRPYQRDALDSVATAIGSGLRRVLLKLPTGTGKTVMFANFLTHDVIAGWLGQQPGRGARMLVIAHREELLTQAQAKIRDSNPSLMVSIEQGENRASRYSDVVVASIQTLAARDFTRLHVLLRHHSFNLVVVDEAHHAAAKSYRTALSLLGFLPPADAAAGQNFEAASSDDVEVMTKALEGWDQKAPRDRLLVGVTATPNRSDAIGLACVFQSMVYNYGLRAAIDDGWLVPVVPWVVETKSSLDSVRITAGEFNQKDLAATVNNGPRNDLAVAALREHATDRPTLAFTVDVAHAHALAEAFQQAGISAAAVSGETPKDDRRATLRAFTEGRIQVVTNCMVLTEGTDLPLASCILHAKPTKSATLYEQMTGRGLRIHPGKTDCIVIDLVDIARKHSLMSTPTLFGLPPGLVANGKDLRKAQEELETFREAYPSFDVDGALSTGHLTLEQLGALARSFDVWTVPALQDEIKAQVAMNWLRSGDDTYRLQYPWADGIETLVVQPDMLGHFELSCTLRPKSGGHARQRTLANQLPNATVALLAAETFLKTERGNVMRLKDREAPWREGQASAAQLRTLARFRIPHNPKALTKGQASDLLDLCMAKRSR